MKILFYLLGFLIFAVLIIYCISQNLSFVLSLTSKAIVIKICGIKVYSKGIDQIKIEEMSKTNKKDKKKRKNKGIAFFANSIKDGIKCVQIKRIYVYLQNGAFEYVDHNLNITPCFTDNNECIEIKVAIKVYRLCYLLIKDYVKRNENMRKRSIYNARS